MIVAAEALSETHASAAAIAAGSEAQAVINSGEEPVEIGRRVETGVGTEIKVLMLKQTEEVSRAQEPCATARRG